MVHTSSHYERSVTVPSLPWLNNCLFLIVFCWKLGCCHHTFSLRACIFLTDFKRSTLRKAASVADDYPRFHHLKFCSYPYSYCHAVSCGSGDMFDAFHQFTEISTRNSRTGTGNSNTFMTRSPSLLSLPFVCMVLKTLSPTSLAEWSCREELKRKKRPCARSALRVRLPTYTANDWHARIGLIVAIIAFDRTCLPTRRVGVKVPMSWQRNVRVRHVESLDFSNFFRSIPIVTCIRYFLVSQHSQYFSGFESKTTYGNGRCIVTRLRSARNWLVQRNGSLFNSHQIGIR